jgi:hypothetical protein
MSRGTGTGCMPWVGWGLLLHAHVGQTTGRGGVDFPTQVRESSGGRLHFSCDVRESTGGRPAEQVLFSRDGFKRWPLQGQHWARILLCAVACPDQALSSPLRSQAPTGLRTCVNDRCSGHSWSDQAPPRDPWGSSADSVLAWVWWGGPFGPLAPADGADWPRPPRWPQQHRAWGSVGIVGGFSRGLGFGGVGGSAQSGQVVAQRFYGPPRWP